MDLMVREGMQKMGTPKGKIRIDLHLVDMLERWRIEVSQTGVAWFENCINPEEVPTTISVHEGHTLRLYYSYKYEFIWKKMPFSVQLRKGISRLFFFNLANTLNSQS
jgi:hypothetical protein